MVGATPEMTGIMKDRERATIGGAPEMIGAVDEKTTIMTTITITIMTTTMIMTTTRHVTVVGR